MSGTTLAVNPADIDAVGRLEGPARSDGSDPAREKYFDEQGIGWEHTVVLLTSVDIKTGTERRQPRGESVNKGTVARYADLYRDGVQFPSLILWANPDNGKLEAIGGIQRYTAAASVGLTEHSAYVLTCTEQQAMAYAYVDNTTNGDPIPYGMAVQNALWLHEACGMTLQQSAHHCAVTAVAIQEAQAIRDNYVRADALGGGAAFDRITNKKGQKSVGRIQSDVAYMRTVTAIADLKLVANDAVGVVDHVVKNCRTDAATTSFLDSVAAEHKPTPKGRPKTADKKIPSAFDDARALIGKVADLQPVLIAASAPGDKASIESMRSALTQALARVDSIRRELDTVPGGGR